MVGTVEVVGAWRQLISGAARALTADARTEARSDWEMTGVRDVTPAVRLRSVEDRDLEVFFDHQADPQAVEMAAFPARDKDQFAAHWAKLRGDDTLFVRTIVADGVVAGNIGSWPDNGQQLLGYWVGREFWGRGVATQALALLVDEVSIRPLYAHVVTHNLGSIRVLEKCGFRRDRVEEPQAPAPGDGIGELVYRLNA
jgi:RimJ/RimL family protein N-acetyltransferase